MNTIFFRRGSWLGTLLLAAAVSANAANAEDALGRTAVTVTVEYSDINIATAAGAQTLYRRIVSAARSVCGPMEIRSPAKMSAYRSCLRGAVDGAVEEIGSPMLTALHQGRAIRQASG